MVRSTQRADRLASKVLLATDSELVSNNVIAQGGHHAPQKPAYAPAPPHLAGG
jgi:hypothetical protein